jgi:VIT1/CCC1 family predicted Fe2+/Mn2+ transporter
MEKNLMDDLRQGFFFGLNSGIITTCGLITGLVQTNINHKILIISVLSLAISDSFSESYGLYLSKKAENVEDLTRGPIYSLVALFLTKFVIVISFLLPLLFTKSLKVFKNMSWVIAWSVIVLFIVDYNLSKMRNENIWEYILPHGVVLFVVMFTTKYFGNILQN